MKFVGIKYIIELNHPPYNDFSHRGRIVKEKCWYNIIGRHLRRLPAAFWVRPEHDCNNVGLKTRWGFMQCSSCD